MGRFMALIWRSGLRSPGEDSRPGSGPVSQISRSLRPVLRGETASREGPPSGAEPLPPRDNARHVCSRTCASPPGDCYVSFRSGSRFISRRARDRGDAGTSRAPRRPRGSRPGERGSRGAAPSDAATGHRVPAGTKKTKKEQSLPEYHC